jgi:hypothetical protein
LGGSEGGAGAWEMTSRSPSATTSGIRCRRRRRADPRIEPRRSEAPSQAGRYGAPTPRTRPAVGRWPSRRGGRRGLRRRGRAQRRRPRPARPGSRRAATATLLRPRRDGAQAARAPRRRRRRPTALAPQRRRAARRRAPEASARVSLSVCRAPSMSSRRLERSYMARDCASSTRRKRSSAARCRDIARASASRSGLRGGDPRTRSGTVSGTGCARPGSARRSPS